MWPKVGRAVNLIEKLFEHISQKPKFQQLGLVMNKIETTSRKEAEILQKIQDKIQKDGD